MPTKGAPDTYKETIEAPAFLDLSYPNKIIDNIGASGIMGHNRHATRGGKTWDGAHPFTHGDITLMHNGTLTTQVGLPNHTKFTVDSENICYALSQQSVEEVIPKLKGAFALTWYNEAEGTFNIIRNDERPLAIAFHPTRQVLYYASEAKMLNWILDRNAIFSKVHEIEEGSWLKFDAKTGNIKPRKKTLEVYEAPVYVAPAYNSNQRSGYNWGNGAGRTQPALPKSNVNNNVNNNVSRNVLRSKLESLGLKSDQEITFYSTGEVKPAVSGSNLGTMEGILEEKPNHMCRVYQISVDSPTGMYKGKVRSVMYENGEPYILLTSVKCTEIHINRPSNAGKREEILKQTAK